MRLGDFIQVFSVLIFITQVNSIMWEMEPNSHKCLKEKIPGNVAVTGEYHVSPGGQRVDYTIKDSNGHILSQKEDIQAGKVNKILFSTETLDVYEVCFVSHANTLGERGFKQEIYFQMKSGVEGKSYEGVAEAAKLKPIEVELKKLEDLSVEIIKGFAQMRKNEEKLRDTNEATNARVFYFSIFSLCCVIGLSIWQAIYLRTYFKAKKLIE